MADPGWWTTAFTAAYQEVYHHRTDAQAAIEVSGLLPRLRQAPGPVIDAGCGAGRHLAALRAADIPVVGFDLSPDLLAAARTRDACRGRLARADLRAPPLATGCGAVLCLFTAFGYFDDTGNTACLIGLADLLAPGGWVVLDLPEPQRLRSGLVPESRRSTPGGWVVDERRRLVGDRVEKDVEARPPQGEPICWRESVRIYDALGIAALAASAGLDVDVIWPGLGGPDDQAGRLVAWLRRPQHALDGPR
jgi:SAM-dependent methyltransferase